jgi:hypothetical protein
MILMSTGAKAALLGGRAFADAFRYGAILIYGDARLETPDAAPTSAPIAAITNLGLPWSPSSVGYGLVLVRVNQFVIGDPTQNWQLRAGLGGEAVWWRLVAPSDSGRASITDCRIDGDVGFAGVPDPRNPELLVPDIELTAGVALPISNFFYAIPPL